MSNEKQIKSKVFSLFSQYNLRTVTLDNLVYIIEDQTAFSSKTRRM